jgi:hypothetical protein
MRLLEVTRILLGDGIVTFGLRRLTIEPDSQRGQDDETQQTQYQQVR